MKKLLGIALLTFLLPMSAIADNEPEQSGCFFLDLECPYKQRQEAARVKKAEEEKQRHDAYDEMEKQQAMQSKQRAEENRKWQEKYQAEQEQLRAKKEQDRKDADARFIVNQAAEKAAHEKEAARWEREDRAEEKMRNDKIAAMKARCGNDYKNPSIGMKIERVQECIAPVKMVSQLNRTDGVVSSYQSGSYWFNVMSGRVVAWGK